MAVTSHLHFSVFLILFSLSSPFETPLLKSLAYSATLNMAPPFLPFFVFLQYIYFCFTHASLCFHFILTLSPHLFSFLSLYVICPYLCLLLFIYDTLCPEQYFATYMTPYLLFLFPISPSVPPKEFTTKFTKTASKKNLQLGNIH